MPKRKLKKEAKIWSVDFFSRTFLSYFIMKHKKHSHCQSAFIKQKRTIVVRFFVSL